jgi:hypothetical protein
MKSQEQMSIRRSKLTNVNEIWCWPVEGSSVLPALHKAKTQIRKTQEESNRISHEMNMARRTV